MTIGILKEPSSETRVSLLPEAVSTLSKKGIKVLVENGAGDQAFASNEDYEKVGALICDAEAILDSSEILLSIQIPQQISRITSKAILIGVYQPLYIPVQVEKWASQGLTVFSMDMLPRTTRAQSMDVLSSQANIAGYKAVLTAATMYGRYFPMFMTAAGSISPAKVLILGAGVAGLQAIATSKRLGAVVEVFDTRPAVKEEVMSLGAKFIEVEGAADASKAGGYAVVQSEEFLQRQKASIAASISKSDIVITTAQIPGKKAPLLITRDMIETMRKGAVIIDLASATGGNTELTQDGKVVSHHGVSILGNSALASTASSDASKLYGKNILNFLQLITSKEQQLMLNFEDDLVKGCCITHDNKVVNERVSSLL